VKNQPKTPVKGLKQTIPQLSPFESKKQKKNNRKGGRESDVRLHPIPNAPRNPLFLTCDGIFPGKDPKPLFSLPLNRNFWEGNKLVASPGESHEGPPFWVKKGLKEVGKMFATPRTQKFGAGGPQPTNRKQNPLPVWGDGTDEAPQPPPPHKKPPPMSSTKKEKNKGGLATPPRNSDSDTLHQEPQKPWVLRPEGKSSPQKRKDKVALKQKTKTKGDLGMRECPPKGGPRPWGFSRP